MLCPQCESYISDNMAFCPFCGYNINPELAKKPIDKASQPKSETLNTNFFGPANIHGYKDEEQDFGHITSAIESPQLEETEDFSRRMQNTLTGIIEQSAFNVAAEKDEILNESDNISDNNDVFSDSYIEESFNDGYTPNPNAAHAEGTASDEVDNSPYSNSTFSDPVDEPYFAEEAIPAAADNFPYAEDVAFYPNDEPFFAQESVAQSENPTANAEDTAYQDEYRVKRSFYPDDYPIVDLSSLPANDVYNEHQREIQNSARQPEYIDRSKMGEFDAYDLGFSDALDGGPDLLGEIRSDKEQPKDESTISISDIFKKAKDSVASVFNKKPINKKPEKKQPFVVNITGDDSVGVQPVSYEKKAVAAKVPNNKKLLPYLIAAAAIIFLIAIIVIISSSSGSSYNKDLFPEIYYDNGKLVLLKSDRPEDKHNIASSGIESVDDVNCFSESGYVYYVKNGDLYCYTIRKLESMRIVRNVYDYVFIDGGEKLCAVSTDGKVYSFNGKDIAALSKDNDAVKSDSLPFVIGDNADVALYLDEYNSTSGSAMINRINKNGKDKALFQAPDGTKNIELLQGQYIMLTDDNGVGALYDINGKYIADFEKYEYSIELGTDSLLIYYKDGTYALFAENTINDLSEETAEIIEVSETDDKFCFKTSDGMCYIYDKGKILNIGDISVYQKFACDLDKNVAYGLEEDVLIFYNISNKTKSYQVADGIIDFAKDKNSGAWMAMGDSAVYRLNDSDCTVIYSEKIASYPIVSDNCKNYLLLNNAGELIQISNNSEQTIAEDVVAFDCDSSFDNIIFVCNDKLYLNRIENRVTTIRDLGSFEFCESN